MIAHTTRTPTPQSTSLRWHRWITALAALLGLALIRPAGAQQVTTTLSPKIVSQGQSAEFIIIYEGPQANFESLPDNFGVPGLNIQGPQTQQSFSLNNNVASYRMELIWSVSAARPGSYTIPSQPITINGQSFTTQEVVLEVREGAAPAASLDPVLRLRIDKSDLYVGEVTPITITALIHRRTQLRNYGHPKLPRENFVVKRFPPPGPAPMIDYNGERFQPIEFRSSISALREGDMQVGPATLDDVLVDFPIEAGADPGRRTPQGFPPSFFQRMTTRQLTLTSDSVQVRVKPLPTEGRPADFAGAVGRFAALSRLGQITQELRVGDPISVDLIVTGEGNFDSLSAPMLASTEGWKVYPSKVMQENRGYGLDPGSQSWNQVIVPQQPLNEIPAFVLSFFDPATASYQTVRTAPIPIVVLPEPARPDPRSGEAPTKDFSVVDVAIPEEKLNDILSLRPATAHWMPLTPRSRESAIFWGAQAIPAALLLAFIAVGLQRHHREKAAAAERARQGKPRPPSEIKRDLKRPNQSRREFYSLAQEFIHAAEFHSGRPADSAGLNGQLTSLLERQAVICYAGPNQDADAPIPHPEQKAALDTLEKLSR